MPHKRNHRFWHTVAQCLYGSIAVAFLTFVCFRLHFHLATTVCLYLIVVVLLSLKGSLLSTAVVSLITVGFLTYFFVPPLFSFRVRDPFEMVAIIVFLTASAVITHFVSQVRKSAEGLREQASLLDLTHDTVFSRRMDDAITYWNRGAEDLYGWPAEEAVGKVSHQLLRTVFPATLGEIKAELLRTGRWEGELIHTKRDGTLVVVASRWSLQRDRGQRPLAILETNNDITERKRAEDALRRQANLLEQTHDAIIVWDFPRTIIFWNRGAEQLYGYSREEAIGRHSHELLQTVHPLPTPVFEASLERDGEWKGELTHTARDGRKILVESRHVLIREPDGRRLVLETNRDITEQKRAEGALRQAQADLAHASRVTTMGELTASLAHEVNQPIAAAITDANTCLRWLARDHPNLEEGRAAASRVVKDATRAADIISRIRLLFKKGTPEREFVDVNDVIQEMLVLLNSEATRYFISVRTELGTDLPQVKADRVQLQQVMMNLIMNSIDAMKDGDGTRDLAIQSQRTENEQLMVSVSDTGVGLPQQHSDRMFDAFFTTKLHGTGMGLAISRSIIESHGGRLWAADNSPCGASFYFTLPSVEAQE
ncbi:MAG TPA: PAS domain S-box protein [Terriglobales bacterium]|nr:PAS domain S-box protein [Terriglobales bacterium]